MGWKRKSVGRKKTRIPVPQKPNKVESTKKDYNRKKEKEKIRKILND
jgi:hypothetical protein